MFPQLPRTKLIRIYGEHGLGRSITPLAQRLSGLTGYAPEDYLPIVTSAAGDLVQFIADESIFKGHYCTSLVMLPLPPAEQFNHVEDQLLSLTSATGLSRIHFTEIMGRQGLSAAARSEFLDRFAAIVRTIPMCALSIAVSRDELLSKHTDPSATDEQLFHTLHWNNIRRAVPALRPSSVVHFVREVENNFTVELCRREFDKLYGGIEQTSELATRGISVCRHPLFFTKDCLLYSGVSDLAAYASSKIQQKVSQGIPTGKIVREYRQLLQTVHSSFANYTGLACRDLVDATARNA